MILRFGEPQHHCRVRPGAYGIALSGDRLLVVRGPSGRWHLPGGGLNDAETPQDALGREILEETGHRLVRATPLAVAEQYLIVENDEAIMKRCHFFTVDVVRELTGGADQFSWEPVTAALSEMAEDASAWAVRTVVGG